MPSKRTRRGRRKASQPTTTTVGSFPFLRLPAEIRDRIYEYALTASYGVQVHWQSNSLRRRVKKPIMMDINEKRHSHNVTTINQLKFVSREVYREAVGLEIKHNMVTFVSDSQKKPGAMRGLQFFVDLCAPTKLRWLRHVMLSECPEAALETHQSQWHCAWLVNHRDDFSNLYQFCRRNQNIRVDLQLPLFSFADQKYGPCVYRITTTALVLYWAFRGEDMSQSLPIFGTRTSIKCQKRAKIMLNNRNVTPYQGSVPNLRFFPMDLDLDVDLFQRKALEKMQTIGLEEFLSDGGMETWVGLAKHWIAHGI